MAVTPKRVLFTVTNDLTYDQRMQKICRSLSGAGYEVELIGRERSFSVALSTEPFKQTRLKMFFNKGKLFYIMYNIRLFFYLLFTKTDAICAIDLDTIAAVYLSGKIKGTKLIYDAHEYFTEMPEVVGRPMVKKIWEWVEKAFVPHFNLAYTVSPAIAELFSKKYDKRFFVIMNVPVLENSQSDKLNLLPATILYQGALNEGRGLKRMITAMQKIDAKLVLAGEGDESEELRNHTKARNLENKVQFLGYVKPDELKKITASATIGINLLQPKGLSYYYSLSNKFFDYIHAGVPQVCIDFPEYRNINEEFEIAVLCKNCKEEKITEAINRLLEDKELYSRLQKNCEVCARTLNWQVEEKNLIALYNDLLR